ncbi:hypothetical protein Y032_0142g2344 [Ancylostoma ceylanicum]|uniref:Uncharacterized protein n=1 Tax=Ancylostoma ceylanicum TaxID=53326 RepID=A0A016T3M2_9BILA|nr:hypothetical protein Y032_0142g2344 [Ancylostoma ceylanicum]
MLYKNLNAHTHFTMSSKLNVILPKNLAALYKCQRIEMFVGRMAGNPFLSILTQSLYAQQSSSDKVG